MSAVSSSLRETIITLQNIPSISQFSLGGGTNLALRYNHRISIDIDFISSEIVGKENLEQIVKDVQSIYGIDKVKPILINKDLEEQYMFLRIFLTVGKEVVKIEFLQNMKCFFNSELVDDIRLVHKTDIGLFKMMSAANRYAKKDIYDLDQITDEINIEELFSKLGEKREKFKLPEHQSLFDLDEEVNPLDYPEQLLKFDEVNFNISDKPGHTHDRIDLVEGSKSWTKAKISWKMKIRKLFNHLGKEFPKPRGRNIR